VNVINGIRSQTVKPSKRAAMYYKTDPFVFGVGSYTHTNNWEILCAAEIITSLGYELDVVNRGFSSWAPREQYDLFLGLGVGNSGSLFAQYSKASKAKCSILLSMGPNPDVVNPRIMQRYKQFTERTGIHAPPMRTVDKVTGKALEDIMGQADAILNIGETGNESYNSFLRFGKPVYGFYPAVSPKVEFVSEWLQTRSRNKFVCFAGNGLICKGVDIVVEAFKRMPENELHICGPPEPAFTKAYSQIIASSPNIHYHGFIEPGGDKFNEVVSSCSYTVFHSAGEGCCTSVATVMKAGIVPVINSWTGINIEDFGYPISEDGCLISSIVSACESASRCDDAEYKRRLEGTLIKSSLFSQDSFRKSYQESLIAILSDK